MVLRKQLRKEQKQKGERDNEIKNKVRGQLEELTVEEKAELAWFILTPVNKK